jgi:hypothetical protein
VEVLPLVKMLLRDCTCCKALSVSISVGDLERVTRMSSEEAIIQTLEGKFAQEEEGNYVGRNPATKTLYSEYNESIADRWTE